MKAYSQDLRQRVLRAIDQGKSQAEVAEMVAISTATIKGSLKARRERGHVLPKAIAGPPSVKGAALAAIALLAQQKRFYPYEHRSKGGNISLVKTLQAAWVLTDFPRISELDLNPVIADPQGAVVADGRAVLSLS